jgi:Recombinase
MKAPSFLGFLNLSTRAADLMPTIRELQRSGATSLRAIAAGLNEAGIPTARGCEWSAVQVRNVLVRVQGS